MATSQTDHGIVNGHWERSEPRWEWLMWLARLGAAELHCLAEVARGAARRSASKPAVQGQLPKAGQNQQGAAAAE